MTDIALFGGTFDPVHNGHISLAQQVVDRFHLKTVLFIPAAFPPHKNTPVASYAHRVAMLEAALSDQPDMAISLIESERSAPSYTYETLLALNKRLNDSNYSLIIGADSLIELHCWHRYRDILDLVNLIIVARPTVTFSQLVEAIARFPGVYTFDAEQRLWYRKDDRRMWYLADVDLPFSSSAIRERLRHGEQVKMLPPLVATYIKQHGLYKE